MIVSTAFKNRGVNPIKTALEERRLYRSSHFWGSK